MDDPARIMFLLKFFTERAHAESFLAGSLLLRNLDYFKVADGGDGRGDRHEAPWAWLQPQKVQLRIGDHTIAPEDFAAPIVLQESYQTTNLLCLYAGTAPKDGIPLDDALQHMKIPDECKLLGAWVVLVHDLSRFFEQLDIAVRRERYGLERGLVSYFDEATESTWFDRPLFAKKRRYAWQREYRCAVKTSVAVPDLVLEIGDLAHCCKLFPVSELEGPTLAPRKLGL